MKSFEFDYIAEKISKLHDSYYLGSISSTNVTDLRNVGDFTVAGCGKRYSGIKFSIYLYEGVQLKSSCACLLSDSFGHCLLLSSTAITIVNEGLYFFEFNFKG